MPFSKFICLALLSLARIDIINKTVGTSLAEEITAWTWLVCFYTAWSFTMKDAQTRRNIPSAMSRELVGLDNMAPQNIPDNLLPCVQIS